jgi:hypothetical protein
MSKILEMCGDGQLENFVKRIEEIEVLGVKVYDPRDNSWKVSDNPALVMADLACRKELKTNWKLDKVPGNFFWDKIAMLAEFCDKLSEQEK